MRGFLPHEKVCTLGLSARGSGLDLAAHGLSMGCPIFVHHFFFLNTESKLARSMVTHW